MINFKTYWQDLNDRERWLVMVAGIVSFVYLFYAWLYSPLASAVDDRVLQLNDKKATLTWMRQVQQQYKTHKTAKLLNSSQLLTMFSKQITLTSFHRFPYQLQQTSVGDIQLTFEAVPYNAFILWLRSLEESYVFSVARLNIEPTDVAGVVKLEVILSAGK